MIVLIPDPCNLSNDKYELGKIVSLSASSLDVSDAQRHVMVDIGFTSAATGFNFLDYVRLVQRVHTSRRWKSVRIVVPDVLGSWELTVRNWRRYARALRRYGEVMFVAQEMRLPPDDLDPSPDIIAVPSHAIMINGMRIYCSREPQLCVQYIARTITSCDCRFHLLGPSLAVVRSLRARGLLDRVESIDTSAYRTSPPVARRGVRMVRNTAEACTWAQSWISRALS